MAKIVLEFKDEQLPEMLGFAKRSHITMEQWFQAAIETWLDHERNIREPGLAEAIEITRARAKATDTPPYFESDRQRALRIHWSGHKMPQPGERYRLVKDVDRYPYFVAKAGMTGTIVDKGEYFDAIELKMDEPLENAEEWDNSIQWLAIEEHEEFWADTELIPERRYNHFSLWDIEHDMKFTPVVDEDCLYLDIDAKGWCIRLDFRSDIRRLNAFYEAIQDLYDTAHLKERSEP